MSARSEFLFLKVAFVLLVCLLLAGDANAYTLPAPEFFTQFMALAAWAGVAFSSVMLYPVYAMMHYFAGSKPKAPAPAEAKAETNDEG